MRNGSILLGPSALLSLLLSSCADDKVRVPGSARFFNGATPPPSTAVATQSAVRDTSRGIAAAAAGSWSLSPDRMTLKLTAITLRSADNSGVASPVDCAISYDKSKPTLTQIADCSFSAETGTYAKVDLTFAESYDLFINDDVNGFYTTSSGIVTTRPSGGAQTFAFKVPQAANGSFTIAMQLREELVVTESTPLSLSLVLNGLRFFSVQVGPNGTVTLGSLGGNAPQRPDIVAAIGTVAGVEFYSVQAIPTGNSYCASCVGPSLPQGIRAVIVFYTAPSTADMVGLEFNGQPANCSPLSPGFVNNRKGYVGLDPSGNIAWAMATDASFATYSAELRLARVSSIGAATTLYCKNRTGDPAPLGGSYASGAPNIAQSANSLGTYVLVAK